jgi:hypothetical protein
VPREAPLELRVGIGEIDVRSGDESLKVVMGIGDLEIRAPLERVRSVRVVTRLGDASLRGGVRHEGRRRMLLGAAVAWSEGEGAADIDVGLRIGDASVVLD